jgi:hypothetical protein
MRANESYANRGGGIVSYFYFNQIISFLVRNSVTAQMRFLQWLSHDDKLYKL